LPGPHPCIRSASPRTLLAADFTRLPDEVRSVETPAPTGCTSTSWTGHFVPNLTFGPFITAAIKKCGKDALDVT
jgi:ribulose-phosphate 3-epimerase